MKELSTEIEIDASPEKIWSILMDFPGYPSWNPFIREISGDAKVGSGLKVYLKPTGGMGMTLTPTVVKADTNKVFGWKGKLGVSGIFDGQHEFVLETNGPGKVRFIHREEFTGFLVPLIWPMLEKNTRRGFEEMNSALKNLAESN